ncbi:NUDIX domain-containing protein [Salinimicrobium sp. GXAS 041]|uniref:NUDIX domain-containing protein n=1 Tax=Salinimicrobium sp. GXAS 041 TaxID=3400806 RepID=UPI003C793D15
MSNQNISLTADSAIFRSEGERTELLLVQRKYDPYKGLWALPGGFLKDDETLEDGAKRELEEETGLKVERLEQIRAYGIPDRNPRGRTVSIGFWGELKEKVEVKGNDDAELADWHDVQKLPKLAFDHDLIVEEAFQKYSSKKSN